MRPSAFLLALLPALVGGAPIGLSAQSAAQRAELVRFRDSLAASTDLDGLRALETTLIGEARVDRANAMLHLRLGFLALRLGELNTGDAASRHFDDAGSEFEWATQEQPNWPWGWYGLGLAELALGDSDTPIVSGFQLMLGRDALTRSANAFARSAEVDPGFVAGLVELSNTALRQRANARMDVALAALRRASRTPSAMAPEVLLARGRIERAVGSLDSSSAALKRLLQRDSTNTVASYEMARTRFQAGDVAAMGQWLNALSAGDSATLTLYRDDLVMVLPDSLLQRFDAGNAAARVELLRQFWQSRDDDDLRERGSRLAEHYRRLDHVRRHYRLVSERRRIGIQERYHSGQSEYDDRGVIYLRHGEPDERVRYAAPGIEPNESWLYHRDTGDLIFHFVARDDVQDFRLVESLFDVLDYWSAVSLNDGDHFSSQHAQGLLLSRASFHPIYSRLMGVGRGGAPGLLTEERSMGRSSIAVGTTTDSWPLDPGESIDASWRVIAAGADSSGPRLQVVFALPRSALVARPDEGGAGFPVRVRGSVIDLEGRTIARFDTTRTLDASAGQQPGDPLMGRLPVSVEAGRFTVRLAFSTEVGGMVTTRDTVQVASLQPPGPGLSDIVLGTRSEALPWQVTPSDTAWLDPEVEFRRDEPLQLYFEVTGMAPGESWEESLEVHRTSGGSIFRRIFGGGKVALRIESEHQHPGGIGRIHRQLDLSRLSPGEYRFVVIVRDDAGRESTRGLPIRVVE